MYIWLDRTLMQKMRLSDKGRERGIFAFYLE